MKNSKIRWEMKSCCIDLDTGKAHLLTGTDSLCRGDEGEQDAGEERATPATENTACSWQRDKRESNEEKEMLKSRYVGGGGEETRNGSVEKAGAILVRLG